jgi:hypothetical protein
LAQPRLDEGPSPPELTQTSPGALEADKASGAFLFSTVFRGSKTMNLQADAMTRATQIATNAIKSKWRDEGRKLSDFRISDHRKRLATTSATTPRS